MHLPLPFGCCRVNTAENYFFVSVYFICQCAAKFAFVLKISTFQENHLHSKVTCTTWKTICQKVGKSKWQWRSSFARETLFLLQISS